MILDTEYRRVVAGKTIIRLPKTSTRKCHVTWIRLLERVEQDRHLYGCQAWIGPLYRAGALVEESTLYAGREHPPVLLETTQAAPLERGSRLPRGRWRQLFILWQWDPRMGSWRELGRIEDSPLDSSPELRQLARRALRQDLWRDTESTEQAADRIHRYLESEYAQLGQQRAEIIAIVYSLLITRMCIEDEEFGFGKREFLDGRRYPHRRQKRTRI